jgi:hypothetical protein
LLAQARGKSPQKGFNARKTPWAHYGTQGRETNELLHAADQAGSPVEIEAALCAKEKSLFSLKESILLYDLTSTYFEGLYLCNPKANSASFSVFPAAPDTLHSVICWFQAALIAAASDAASLPRCFVKSDLSAVTSRFSRATDGFSRPAAVQLRSSTSSGPE